MSPVRKFDVAKASGVTVAPESECCGVKVTREEIPKELPDEKSQPWYKHQDFVLWLVSLVLFLVLVAGIMGIGALRGWDANSGYDHNTSATSRDRFWPESFVDEPGVPGRFGDGAAGRWYYWKLPPPEVTWFTRGLMWFCYLAHQFTVWTLIYIAQRKQNEKEKVSYSHRFRWYNVALYAGNVFFHLLHLAQTHWTYDALAQDTSINSSQASVVVMLGFIFVLEYRDRGLVFGWSFPYANSRASYFLKLPYVSMYLVRKYHGYAFAWAAIYTMWYHPMESTWGHVMGFFHTYILLVQASLIYTPMHLNKYWRFVLEAWVAVHGTWVAVQTGGPDKMGTSLWPMFGFGFCMTVCIIQLFGLPFWRRLPAATRIIPLLCLLVVIIGNYSWIPDDQGRPWRRMYEVIFIPMILLLLPVFIFGLLYLLIKIDAILPYRNRNNHFLQGVFLALAVLMFMLCVLFGFVVLYFDVQIPVQVLQAVFYVVYPILYCFGLIFIKNALNEKEITKPIIPEETEEEEAESDKSKST